MLGLVVFTVSSLACALAGSGGLLIAARALQGLGAALILPSTLSIISATFHPRERATAIGIWVGVSSIGLALGPLVGGALIETINWHWIFYVNVPLGAAGVVAARLLVPESRDRSLDRALDLPGLASVRRSALCAHVRAPRGEPLRLDVGPDRRVSRRGRGRSRRVHPGRAAVTKADARPLAVSQRHLQRRQRGQPAQLLRPVRRLLLRFDLPAERARLQRAPHGRDLAAVHDPPGAERARLPGGSPTASARAGRWRPGCSCSASRCSSSPGSVSIRRSATCCRGSCLGGLGVGMTLAPASAAVLASVPDDKAGVASGVVTTFRQTGGVLGVAVMGAIFAAQIGDLDPARSAVSAGLHGRVRVRAAGGRRRRDRRRPDRCRHGRARATPALATAPKEGSRIPAKRLGLVGLINLLGRKRPCGSFYSQRLRRCSRPVVRTRSSTGNRTGTDIPTWLHSRLIGA